MSDYLPFEMQMEIVKKLPVMKVLQFRTVSKPWKAWIDSPSFFFGYGVRKSANDVFYLSFNHGLDGSILSVDENLFHTPVITYLPIQNMTPVGSSHGIFCFTYGSNLLACIMNPSIRKEIGMYVPNTQPEGCKMLLGFSVRPDTLDPTIVRISYPASEKGSWSVFVFTLSSLAWNELDITRLPRESVRFKRSTQAVVGQFIYWVGYEMFLFDDGEVHKHYVLVSFDLINHCFQVINIPWAIRRGLSPPLYVANLEDSLVISGNLPTLVYYVFVCSQLSIEGGRITSAPAIMTIPSGHFLKLLCFNSEGEPIVEAASANVMAYSVQVYMNNAQSFEELTVQGNAGSFFAGRYKESLILAAYENHRIHFAG